MGVETSNIYQVKSGKGWYQYGTRRGFEMPEKNEGPFKTFKYEIKCTRVVHVSKSTNWKN